MRLLPAAALFLALIASPARADFEALTLETSGASVVRCQPASRRPQPSSRTWLGAPRRSRCRRMHRQAPAGTDYESPSVSGRQRVKLRRVRRLRRGAHKIILTADGGVRVIKRLRIKR